MKITAEHYLDASRSRADTARRLHEAQRYSASIYFAGIAVECLLRAYVVRRDPRFDSRHDLMYLFKRSGIEEFITPEDRIHIGAWLGEVWSKWKNDYRYASDDRLRTEFKRLQHDRDIKGDYLKENSRRVLEAALQLRTKGELRWNSKKN